MLWKRTEQKLKLENKNHNEKTGNQINEGKLKVKTTKPQQDSQTSSESIKNGETEGVWGGGGWLLNDLSVNSSNAWRGGKDESIFNTISKNTTKNVLFVFKEHQY